ncbi:outer membrane protein assembly factor [Cellulophaga sp. L1A9]|uniref:outer membrane protein assembly factor n=1 Tax=Cellulophaga sp. L1A9 TaxID=2686362 RepID=UPI00131C9C50|nr:outer membrane protein assembly factor [Cellulophaga sp. L1A9]
MKLRAVLICFLLIIYSNALGQELTINEIIFTGLKRTNSSFISKIITSRKGDVLDTLALENDILTLKRLPPVANATFKIKELSTHTVQVIFTIEENFTLIPFANLFSSSNDDFAFRLGLQEFNLLGRNITLGGFYQYDIFNSYGINVRAPYLFSNKFGLALSYNDFTTQEPVFFSEATADYKYNNKGIEVLGLYQINLKNTVEIGFSFFSEDYQYINGFTSNEVPTALNVDKHLWKLLYNFDALNYHYQYINGFKSALNLQYVQSTNSNLPDFVIGFNDFLFYKRIGQKGNLANRVRLGLATNSDSPFAPFTLDNNLNIRGVGNTIDRGTGAIVFNTEYRHTLIDKEWFVLQSNIFIDGGSWRNPGGKLSDFNQNENIRIYPGVGLRFMHKKVFNAIFRIDYGYGVTKDATKGLVFGIGQYF